MPVLTFEPVDGVVKDVSRMRNVQVLRNLPNAGPVRNNPDMTPAGERPGMARIGRDSDGGCYSSEMSIKVECWQVMGIARRMKP